MASKSRAKASQLEVEIERARAHHDWFVPLFDITGRRKESERWQRKHPHCSISRCSLATVFADLHYHRSGLKVLLERYCKAVKDSDLEYLCNGEIAYHEEVCH